MSLHKSGYCSQDIQGCEECLQINGLKEALVKAEANLAEFGKHKDRCIRSYWQGGRPTINGGYEVKYDGEWYQLIPVDQSPECQCGLDVSLAEIRRVLGGK